MTAVLTRTTKASLAFLGPRHLAVGFRTTRSQSSQSDCPDQSAVFAAMLRIEALDARLGMDVGAQKERAKYQAVIKVAEQAAAVAQTAAYAAAQATEHATMLIEVPLDKSCDFKQPVARICLAHSETDHVAIFGGNPAKRRLLYYESSPQGL